MKKNILFLLLLLVCIPCKPMANPRPHPHKNKPLLFLLSVLTAPTFYQMLPSTCDGLPPTVSMVAAYLSFMLATYGLSSHTSWRDKGMHPLTASSWIIVPAGVSLAFFSHIGHCGSQGVFPSFLSDYIN